MDAAGHYWTSCKRTPTKHRRATPSPSAGAGRLSLIFPKPQNMGNGFSCAKCPLIPALNTQRLHQAACGVPLVLLRAGESKRFGEGRAEQTSQAKRLSFGPSPPLARPRGPLLPAVDQEEDRSRGTESLAVNRFRSRREGTRKGAEKRASREALSCEVEIPNPGVGSGSECAVFRRLARETTPGRARTPRAHAPRHVLLGA